jgi:hypothetical protein
MAEQQKTSAADKLAEQAQMKSSGPLVELWDFLKHNKKWWLVPVILVLLLMGALLVLGATGAAPFIYTLF